MTDSSAPTSCCTLGAKLSSEGVRYTVWAPEKKEVSLHIRRTASKQEATIPLKNAENGYFTALD